MESTRSHLNATTLKIFRLLWSGVRLSRNQHFDLYRDPKAMYARRLHRLFVSLAVDLERHGRGATVYTALDESVLDGSIGVQIEIPLLKGTRTVYLSSSELALFAECAPTPVAELLVTLTRAALSEAHPSEVIRNHH